MIAAPHRREAPPQGVPPETPAALPARGLGRVKFWRFLGPAVTGEGRPLQIVRHGLGVWV